MLIQKNRDIVAVNKKGDRFFPRQPLVCEHGTFRPEDKI